MLKDFIDTTFASPGTAARMCKDEDSALQNMAVAAILAHEINDWVGREQYRQEFVDTLQGAEYAAFWRAFQTVKEQNQDILKKGEELRLAIEKRETFGKIRKTGAKTNGAMSQGSSGKATGVSKKDRYPRKAKANVVKKDEDSDVEMD